MFLWSLPSEHLAEGSGSASHTGFLNTPLKNTNASRPTCRALLSTQCAQMLLNSLVPAPECTCWIRHACTVTSASPTALMQRPVCISDLQKLYQIPWCFPGPLFRPEWVCSRLLPIVNLSATHTNGQGRANGNPAAEWGSIKKVSLEALTAQLWEGRKQVSIQTLPKDLARYTRSSLPFPAQILSNRSLFLTHKQKAESKASWFAGYSSNRAPRNKCVKSCVFADYGYFCFLQDSAAQWHCSCVFCSTEDSSMLPLKEEKGKLQKTVLQLDTCICMRNKTALAPEKEKYTMTVCRQEGNKVGNKLPTSHSIQYFCRKNQFLGTMGRSTQPPVLKNQAGVCLSRSISYDRQCCAQHTGEETLQIVLFVL